jgi:homoserine dehydrogenase
VRTDFIASHYVRFVVRDRPGIIAELAAVFGRHGIGIDAVLQEPGYAPAELPFVIALDGCAAGKMTRALAEIARLAFHVRPPVCLPILETAEVHAPAM